MSSTWNDVALLMKDSVPEHSYRMWLEPLKLNKIGKSSITLSCPNIFSKKNILLKYGELLKVSIHKIMGKHLSLQLVVPKKNTPSENIEKSIVEATKGQITLPGMDFQPRWARRLRKDFTFDQFVVGSSNDFAYSAALSIASKEVGGLNSLFLLAKTGLGKSHLSQAVGHHIISQFPQKKVYYVTAEDFTNEMVVSYKNNNIEQFKDKYRNNCDVLLMDEIQNLSGKIGTQKELVGTLDFLTDGGKKIIFSSSLLPTEIPKLSDKLKSRLCTGLITNLEPPDYQTKVKILKHKAKSGGHILSGEIIRYLAGELGDDIRQLESGILGVATKASLLGGKADLLLAESVIKNIVTTRSAISIGLIKKLICNQYNIEVDDLMSRSRRKAVAWPRQVGMYLSRRYTDHSLQSIGKGFNRYHATCMHGVKTVTKAINNDVGIKKQIDILSKKLETGTV